MFSLGGEALGLRWMRLTYRGAPQFLANQNRALGAAIVPRIMRSAERNAPIGPTVFPATHGDGSMKGFRKLWNRTLKLGEMAADVIPNVLRHSFTSLGADIGYSDVTIVAIVGHKGRTTTSRYIRSADAVLLSGADAIADQTDAPMRGLAA